MEDEKIIVLGYRSEKEDDGEPLYTDVKIFQNFYDFKNYMSTQHHFTPTQTLDFLNSEEPVDDMVVWEQPFDK